MTAKRFRLIPGSVDTAGNTKSWLLVEANGRIRCEMTDAQYADCAVEAMILADTLTANCAQAGIFLKESISRYSARYVTD